MSLAELASSKEILVVCGSGGVGKTTTAASIATAAALDGSKVLVLTVDPARRLADVLGIATGAEPTPVALDAFGGTTGELHAQMLDTKTAWDHLVDRHAPDRETATRILTNPLYGEITERFVQSHDYIAMETLHEIHGSGRYDLIVIDTPPATQAIDFLDAPERMAAFFDSRLLKFLVAPSRTSLMSITTRAFLRLADSLLGRSFLEDITELFTLLETMRPGFIARANETSALLRDDRCSFVVVTTPEPAPAKSARNFVEALGSRRLDLGAVVMNKVLPAATLDTAAATALRDAVADLVARSDRPAATARVSGAMADNHDRFAALARAEADIGAAIGTDSTVKVSAPWFEQADDMSALVRLGESIWR